ncbi:trypsin-like peptidase domain-containing protein [Robiginitomaculum antarcticum]|uniref:trypsin-like peptidase domain-containing protein n=1 Tax=Robiginitomaculum antarcticum TaxID=437507 RepID=UPI00035FC591|nr:trypsin-like peptidase domain-containing protein [Robiginitomaculum antarcticum]
MIATVLKFAVTGAGALWLGTAYGAMATAQTVPASLTMPSPSGDKMPDSVADLIAIVSQSTVNVISIENGTAAEGASMGQGSGFIISADGKVVTNYHVIRGGDSYEIKMSDGRMYKALVIGTDEETDLAVLQIQSSDPFKFVKFYRGKPLRVGDWVLAIGNPFGIGQSSSVGIISALGRDAEGSGPYVDYLQTDAVINRGNSGGPLYNMTGDVIAVNSAIYSPTGASVGIGYAIPHDIAEGIVYDLVTKGKVNRGFFGAALRTVEVTADEDPNFFREYVTVEGLAPGGPAQIAGLKVEDIIVNINGSAVTDSAEATRKIGRMRAGQTVSFDVFRNNETMTVPVTLAERPAKAKVDALAGVVPGSGTPQAPTAPSGDTGLGLVDLSTTFRDSIGMPRGQVGVYVDTVAPGTHAARKGLQSGMILLEIDQKPIASVSQWESLIAKARKAGKTNILLKVRTLNGSENFVGLPI